jgi:hypothetical protein
MPGTQAQNVRWVALEEQLAPARTGVELGLALALAVELEPALALVVGVVLLDELEPPPLLQAASSVIAATAAIPVIVPELLFDNIWGTPFEACCRLRSATDRRLDEGE